MLHTACMEHNLSAIETLLAQNADANLQDKKRRSPLFHLLVKPPRADDAARHAELVSVLRQAMSAEEVDEVDARVKVDAPESQENHAIPALMERIAAREDLTGAACPALHRATSVRLLTQAAVCGNAGAVRWLLDAKADPMATDSDGHSAALWALWAGNGLEHALCATPQDHKALEHRRQALEAHPQSAALLDLATGPEEFPRDPPPGAAVPPTDPAEDLFPLDYRPPDLLEWLRETGAHPTMWPLKTDPHPPDGAKLNDPMGRVVWDGKTRLCARVAVDPCVNPRRFFVFYLYTVDSALYKQSNQAMRTRQDLAFWRPFIYYVMQEMDSLPTPKARTVYRGLAVPLRQATYAVYAPGATVKWPGLTSTSVSFDVARSFMEKAPEALLCAIKIHTYEDVGPCSQYPEEEEMLIAPGCEFMVVKVIAMPTNAKAVDLALPLSVGELRPRAKVCVVLEQLKTPRVVPREGGTPHVHVRLSSSNNKSPQSDGRGAAVAPTGSVLC